MNIVIVNVWYKKNVFNVLNGQIMHSKNLRNSTTNYFLLQAHNPNYVCWNLNISNRSMGKIIPSLLVLNDCGIDTAGSENLSLKCCDVTELDLAQNKLKEWAEILEILRHMPHLKFVNLSFNDLSNEMTKFDAQCNNYVYLKFLVLNSTHTPWSTVRKLLKSLPNLEELHLCFNEYHEVGLCENCDIHQEKHEKKMIHHERIKRLHFTGNPIHTWREISKLGESFPLLEALVLTECPIKNLDPFWSEGSEAKSIHEMEVSKSSFQLENENESNINYRRTDSECESNQKNMSAHHFFRYLKFLNLNFTLLSSWDEIDRLGKFPQLHSLRIQGCPLFEANQYTEHERRQLLIARLANIQTLNGGGTINAEEREDAERAFIRYYMEKPESDRPERYTDLVNIHGKLDPLVNIDLTPEKRVTVMIVYKDLSEKRSLNVYQTVSELKQKLDGFAGIPARKMKLFYLDQDMKGVMGPEEMRYPNKQLYSYNICNGDEILVDEKMATFKSSS